MNHLNPARSAGPETRLHPSAPIAMAARLLKKYRAGRTVANTLAELRQLDDHQLRDIGLSRSDLF